MKKVLILTSNPVDTPHLQIESECRAVERAIRSSPNNDLFDLHRYSGVTAQDIQSSILRHSPDIVHMTCHGTPEGLILEKGNGISNVIHIYEIQQLFSLLKPSIQLVVFTGGYTDAVAAALSPHIPYMIGMNDIVTDEMTVAFSTAFYEALAFGKDVLTAFRLGTLQINNLGLGHSHDTVQIYSDNQPPLSFVDTTYGHQIEHETRFSQGVDIEGHISIGGDFNIPINVFRWLPEIYKEPGRMVSKDEHDQIRTEVEELLSKYGAPQSNRSSFRDLSSDEFRRVYNLAIRIIEGDFDPSEIEEVNKRYSEELSSMIQEVISLKDTDAMRELESSNPYFSSFPAKIIKDDFAESTAVTEEIEHDGEDTTNE